MTTPPAIELVVQTLRAHNALLRASRRLFRPFGLSEAQFNVLHILQEAATPLTQRELSEILVVDRSNVTGLIDRMELAGWVKRMPVPHDRRAYRVVLTPEGRELWRTTHPVYAAAAEEVVRDLKPSQLTATLKALATLENRANEIA